MKTFPLSLQETFDLAYNGVVNQGCASENASDCLYDGPDDTKCAAGHVFAAIEPEFDLKEIDEDGGSSARGVLFKMGYIENLNRHGQRDFTNLLQGAQGAHDSAASVTGELGDFVEEYKDRMAKLAMSYDLTIPK